MFFNEGLAAFGAHAESAQEVIHLGSQLLLDAGAVKPDYEEHVLEREKSFPTGLDVGFAGIAIPHTDSAYVNRSQIAFVSLDEPVEFRFMADDSQIVQVTIAFVIAMSQPHEQVEILSNLMALAGNEDAIRRLQACTTVDELHAILAENGIE